VIPTTNLLGLVSWWANSVYVSQLNNTRGIKSCSAPFKLKVGASVGSGVDSGVRVGAGASFVTASVGAVVGAGVGAGVDGGVGASVAAPANFQLGGCNWRKLVSCILPCRQEHQHSTSGVCETKQDERERNAPRTMGVLLLVVLLCRICVRGHESCCLRLGWERKRQVGRASSEAKTTDFSAEHTIHA